MLNRRSFLKATPALAAGGALAAAETPAHANALAREVGQVKIKEVNAYAVNRAVFAQVIADDGTEGWGECGHSGGWFVAALVNRELSDLAEGADVFDAEPLWHKLFFEIDELGPGGIASQALAGVDCALWDLRGKLLGVPVWALLGGKFRSEISLYGSFSRSLGGNQRRTPASSAEHAAELVEEGFQSIKVRLAIREENQDPADDPALPTMRAVRDAVGDDIELFVDANNGYTAFRAIEIGKQLRDEVGITAFEEPVAAYQYPALAQVADALDLPVTAGEHEYTRWQFRDLILNGRVDVLNPDVSKLAGLTEAKKVAALAEVFDRPMAVHNARPTLLTAAHLHFVASSLNAHRRQEHPRATRLDHLWDYFENRTDVSNGIATVSDLPGLGLVPRVAAIKRDAK
ncbi:MAG: mandelate racemase/muconate lactonizing enzyme family protein [Bacteroidota bacterium]